MLLTAITIYHTLKSIVTQFFSALKFQEREHPKGRKPTLTNSEVVTCAIFKQRQNIATIQSLHDILEPSLSYQKFVDALKRAEKYLAVMIAAIMRALNTNAHPVKFTDSTELPVCLPKNATHHRTMRGFAEWSKSSKGWFYGLKLHLSSDVEGRVLALRLTPGNADDRLIFRKMNEKLHGLFVADAGYVGEKLGQDFCIEGERLLITAVRANMKKLATFSQVAFLNLRMRVEINFRMLKVCYGLVTSFPRSVDGYLTHYLAAIAAHLLA